MRKLLLFTFISVLLAVASFCLSPQYKQKSFIGSKVFPELRTQLDAIDEMHIFSRYGEIVIVKNGDNMFVIPEKADLPARADRVKNIILGAAMLEYFEKKTVNADNFKDMALQDVSDDKDNKAVRLIIKAKGKVVFDMILGREKFGLSGFSNGIFIRRPDDNQVWLARRYFDATGNVMTFINHVFPAISVADIKGVTIGQGKNKVEIKDKEKFASLFGFFEDLSFYDAVKDEGQGIIAEYEYKIKGGITVNVYKVKAEKGNPYVKITVSRGKAVTDEGLRLYAVLKDLEGRLYKIPADNLSRLPEIKNDKKRGKAI